MVAPSDQSDQSALTMMVKATMTIIEVTCQGAARVARGSGCSVAPAPFLSSALVSRSPGSEAR